MVHSVWCIGLLTSIWGIIAAVQPTWQKGLLHILAKGRRIYWAVALKIIVGIVFLIFATSCRIPWIMIVLGCLTVVASVLFAALPLDKIHRWLQWWQNRPLWFYRIWGAAAVLFGALIIFAGLPTS
jgi:hypothetical protein